MDLILYLTIAWLIFMTICSFLPLIPNGLLSSLSLILYWNHIGFDELNIPIMVSLILLGIIVEITEFASGIVAGKLSGLPTKVPLLGSIIGICLLFVLGPIGFLIGISFTVFIYTLYVNEEELNEAIKKSLYSVIGALASDVIKFVLLLVLTLIFIFITII